MHSLSKSLFNIRGQFYPRDHVLAMLPSEGAARAAARELCHQGTATDAITILSPEDIRGNLAPSGGESDSPLPSPGTEAQTSRRLVQFAQDGHWALLIHSKHREDDDRMVAVLTQHNAPLAERYRALVIEDLVQDVR
jgi:hypothetical protein